MRIDVDALAQFIRKVDGDNRMGAGALAEKIIEWIDAQPVLVQPAMSGWQLDNIEAKVVDLGPDAESCVSNGDVAELVKAVRTLQVRQMSLIKYGEPSKSTHSVPITRHFAELPNLSIEDD